MKKGESYSGVVEKMEFPNKGIVTIEDTKVTVKNALPGQEISFVIQKKRKDKAQGRLVGVVNKAPCEIQSPCPHFGSCGGCLMQNFPYEEQLKLKSLQVKELLDAVYNNRGEKSDFVFEDIKPSPRQFGYRNKMEFSFGDEEKDGPLSLGMHKRGSFYDIVTVSECQIVDEDYRLILKNVLKFFEERSVRFYHRMRHEGYLRHLLVRKAAKTGQILIALVTTTQEEHDLKAFTDMLLDLKLSGNIVGILHIKNDSIADVVKSDETVLLYGKDYFYEELLGLKFKISPFSFFQTNSLGAEVLYETARSYIGDLGTGKTVFDLYSGTGTIAQILAPVAKKVIGVEIVEEAVEAAKKNAKSNGLHNCEFLAGDVLKIIDEIKEKPDFIVLDPPRDGIHPKALQKIIAFGVEQILYISCKPTSLARDLDVFLESGYEMVKACCVDMFPGTGNVETVALLTRKKDIETIDIEMEVNKEDVTEKATYKKIQEYVKEKHGLYVHTKYIAEVKRRHGIPMHDAPNKVEVPRRDYPSCPKDKVKAIDEALKYFSII